MANTSPSGPATKIQLTLTGQGADPATMPATTDEKTTASIPDTGIFTSESSAATPLKVGGAICSLIVLFALVLTLKKKASRKISGFSETTSKLVLKNLSLLFGIFTLAFLATSFILPNFIAPEDSASAISTQNAIAVSTGSASNNHVLNMSAALSSSATMAVASETVSVTTATQKGYTLYLSTASAGNRLYYNNENNRGYVAPTAGSLSMKRSLEANHWGFAVGITAAAASKNPASFAAVPTYGKEVAVKQTSSATSANDTTTVVYGANVDKNIPSGDYFNSVLYTAIANI